MSSATVTKMKARAALRTDLLRSGGC